MARNRLHAQILAQYPIVSDMLAHGSLADAGGNRRVVHEDLTPFA
jgi:hypothetical protein